MNEVLEIISRQRACRSFTDEPVDDATIAQLLQAATKAPSSENLQPWVFVVIRDVQRRQVFGGLMRKAWLAGGVEYVKQQASPALLREVDQGLRGGIAAAPVLILVAGDSNRVPKRWLQSSIFPAVQNILLAAGSLGLGSALTTLGATVEGVSDVVGLPDHLIPMALLPIGHPAKELGPPGRDPFEEHTYRETLDQPW